jgi:hypothetical protein
MVALLERELVRGPLAVDGEGRGGGQHRREGRRKHFTEEYVSYSRSLFHSQTCTGARRLMSFCNPQSRARSVVPGGQEDEQEDDDEARAPAAAPVVVVERGCG